MLAGLSIPLFPNPKERLSDRFTSCLNRFPIAQKLSGLLRIAESADLLQIKNSNHPRLRQYDCVFYVLWHVLTQLILKQILGVSV